MASDERMEEIRRILLAKTRDEDLTQQIMTRAFTGTGFDHPDRYWWIAAKNALVNQRKQLRRWSFFPLSNNKPDDYETGAGQSAAPVASKLLKRMLASLSPKDRKFLLGYYKLPHKGTAKMFNQMKVKAFRLREKLRRKYTE